jgi:DNA-binding IclR family transcriptional regulator
MLIVCDAARLHDANPREKPARVFHRGGRARDNRCMDTLAPLLEAGSETIASRFGTQSLSRGIRLMRAIAARPNSGWRLCDIALNCGMDRGTVRRMLACLIDERLVHQRPGDRHYLPGPLMFELGLALPDTVQFLRLAESHLEAFSRRLAGIALLQFRSGDDYVCAARAGALPISASMVFPGTRNPLCTCAGGIAILQSLPDAERQRVLANNRAREIARHGNARLAAIERMLERSAREGLALNLGELVPGVHALAMPIRGSEDAAFAALSIIGTADQYPESRLEELGRELGLISQVLSEEASRLHVTG